MDFFNSQLSSSQSRRSEANRCMNYIESKTSEQNIDLKDIYSKYIDALNHIASGKIKVQSLPSKTQINEFDILILCLFQKLKVAPESRNDIIQNLRETLQSLASLKALNSEDLKELTDVKKINESRKGSAPASSLKQKLDNIKTINDQMTQLDGRKNTVKNALDILAMENTLFHQELLPKELRECILNYTP